MKTKQLLLSTVAAALLAAPVAGALAQGKTGIVKIGVNETLSGKFVGVGLPPTTAIRLAVHEVNEKGFKVGNTTYKFEPIILDNRSEGSVMVANATRLIEDDKVKVIFGPTLSLLANQSQEITVPANVINFSAAGSWQGMGYLKDPKKPLLFGTQLPLPDLALSEVDAMKQLGAKKIAYMGSDDDTTRGNMGPFLAEAKKQGLQAELILFPYNTADFSSFVTRAKSMGLEAVFFLHPQVSAPNLMRAMVELKAFPKGFAGRGMLPAAALTQAIGKPVPFPFISVNATPDLSYPATPAQKAFADKLKGTGVDLGATINFAFFSYDFVPMLAAAMTKAGTVTDTAKIAAALKTITYNGAGGKVCIAKDVQTAIYDGAQIIVREGKVSAKAFPSSCK